MHTGCFKEFDAKGVIDIANHHYEGDKINDLPFLYKDGTIRKKDSDITMLKDVVFLGEDYAITRSGSIYVYEAIQYNDILHEWSFEYVPKNTKSVVYDEWIERLE